MPIIPPIKKQFRGHILETITTQMTHEFNHESENREWKCGGEILRESDMGNEILTLDTPKCALYQTACIPMECRLACIKEK